MKKALFIFKLDIRAQSTHGNRLFRSIALLVTIVCRLDVEYAPLTMVKPIAILAPLALFMAECQWVFLLVGEGVVKDLWKRCRPGI